MAALIMPPFPTRLHGHARMEHRTDYIRFTAALLAISDPLIAIPLFLSHTQVQDILQRIHIALTTGVCRR